MINKKSIKKELLILRRLPLLLLFLYTFHAVWDYFTNGIAFGSSVYEKINYVLTFSPTMWIIVYDSFIAKTNQKRSDDDQMVGNIYMSAALLFCINAGLGVVNNMMFVTGSVLDAIWSAVNQLWATFILALLLYRFFFGKKGLKREHFVKNA